MSKRVDLNEMSAMEPDLLALNNANAQELSWLEQDQWLRLVQKAFLARRIGRADAFLLAFDQGADYDSPNFLWFRSLYKRFVYVDRVVVAASARRCGYGRRLYNDVFQRAALAGHDHVVCEVNSDPPNVVSDAFHAAWGFRPVGSGAGHGGKPVTYCERRLEPLSAVELPAS